MQIDLKILNKISKKILILLVFFLHLYSNLNASSNLSSFISGDGSNHFVSSCKVGTDIYFVGYSNSSNITKKFTSENKGKNDIFIGKISSDSLEWIQYYGSNGDDFPSEIKYNYHDRMIYVVGSTNSSYNFTHGNCNYAMYQGGASDGFVLKIDLEGNIKLISYWGGNAKDSISSISFHDDDIIICGTSSSNNLSFGYNIHQNTLNGKEDCFIAEINDEAETKWCSYFGGEQTDLAANMICLEDDKYAFVGMTKSKNFIANYASLQASLNGEQDVFFAVFDDKGTLLNSSYLGGSKIEKDPRVIKNSKDIYIAGSTNSNDCFNSSYSQQIYSKEFDLFCYKFDENFNCKSFSYFGTKENEILSDIKFQNEYLYLIGASFNSINEFIKSDINSKNMNNKGLSASIYKINELFELEDEQIFGADNDDIFSGLEFSTDQNIFAFINTNSNFNLNQNAFKSSKSLYNDCLILNIQLHKFHTKLIDSIICNEKILVNIEKNHNSNDNYQISLFKLSKTNERIFVSNLNYQKYNQDTFLVNTGYIENGNYEIEISNYVQKNTHKLQKIDLTQNKILGDFVLCNNQDIQTYYSKLKNLDYTWMIENGIFLSENNKDSIKVKWKDNNPQITLISKLKNNYKSCEYIINENIQKFVLPSNYINKDLKICSFNSELNYLIVNPNIKIKDLQVDNFDFELSSDSSFKIKIKEKVPKICLELSYNFDSKSCILYDTIIPQLNIEPNFIIQGKQFYSCANILKYKIAQLDTNYKVQWKIVGADLARYEKDSIEIKPNSDTMNIEALIKYNKCEYRANIEVIKIKDEDLKINSPQTICKNSETVFFNFENIRGGYYYDKDNNRITKLNPADFKSGKYDFKYILTIDDKCKLEKSFSINIIESPAKPEFKSLNDTLFFSNYINSNKIIVKENDIEIDTIQTNYFVPLNKAKYSFIYTNDFSCNSLESKKYDKKFKLSLSNLDLFFSNCNNKIDTSLVISNLSDDIFNIYLKSDNPDIEIIANTLDLTGYQSDVKWNFTIKNNSNLSQDFNIFIFKVGDDDTLVTISVKSILLNYSIDTVDFAKYLNENKIVISNNNPKSEFVKVSNTNKNIELSITEFTLAANSTQEITFKILNDEELLTDTLKFQIECINQEIVYSKENLPIKPIINIISKEASAGDTIIYPVNISNIKELLKNGKKKIKFTLTLNNTVLIVLDSSNIDYNSIVYEVDLENIKSNDTTIYIRMLVNLGTQEISQIKISEIKIDEKVIKDTFVQDFTLLNLCKEGGVRLVDFSKKAAFEFSPNPANDKLVVKLTSYETEEHWIKIFDINGILVENYKFIPKSNNQEIIFDLNKLNSGKYFLFLQTPTIQKYKSLELVK